MKEREIKPENIWNEEKLNSINTFVKQHSENQSKERKIRNKLLSIQYKLEDYIEKESIDEDKVINILDFIKMYLKVLGITKKDLAKYFGMKDSNLHTYLTGKRKLNPDIVLKISSFSRTNPEYWYRVQVKNELVKLRKQKAKDYEKYDYEKLLSIR
ncbi:helix-turn-helix domain-containing protein [Aquimarina sp. ERC-38]|uniref:helix-turn-helix transcriptional regulator n=1 Tax=Aquimarina sp. ERC-38 TaxID=2949996 RepID=UPI002246A2C0|nr:helix-turn-helix domain-containing protein [Aquimarina sp. ERC-38]UZO79991.1 helix-turn-helix domain-containing protein [Aquimarina sp. ERC-38]